MAKICCAHSEANTKASAETVAKLQAAAETADDKTKASEERVAMLEAQLEKQKEEFMCVFDFHKCVVPNVFFVGPHPGIPNHALFMKTALSIQTLQRGSVYNIVTRKGKFERNCSLLNVIG